MITKNIAKKSQRLQLCSGDSLEFEIKIKRLE